MHILLIKTSSMGDIIHTLPAITDAARVLPHIKFDWVIEESFAEIPTWHPAVARVISVALRRWRKNILSTETRQGWKQLRKNIKTPPYDLVLDAQGLVKSALITYQARGIRAGLDWQSARESVASLAYQQKFSVNYHQHAVVRMRSLFSQALGYPLPQIPPDFGLTHTQFASTLGAEKYIVFLHGTTWTSKLWPEEYWIKLAALAKNAGFRVKISGGNDEEVARAKRIAQTNEVVDVMPRLSIKQMATLLSSAAAAVAVDTGFGHLAGALGVPTISLYGSTNAEYTGALGKESIQLSAKFACAPCLKRTCIYTGPAKVSPACFEDLTPEVVWATLVNNVSNV